MQNLLSALRAMVVWPASRRRSTASLTTLVAPNLDMTLVVPTLDLTRAIEAQDDWPERPPLRRQQAALDVRDPRVRDRRNAITHFEATLPAEFAQRHEAQSIMTAFRETLPVQILSARSAYGLTDRTCAICCDEMLADDRVACMPCPGLHAYHHACVHKWIARKPECPKCRWTADETTTRSLELGVARAEAYLQQLRHTD